MIFRYCLLIFVVLCLTVAASVVSKGGHSLYGYPLVVQYVSTEQKVNKCKLLMTQLPSEIETDYLKALLEKTLGTDQFSLEMPDNTSVVLIFYKVYTDAGIYPYIHVCVGYCNC